MPEKKITTDVLESFLHCKLKAHLKEAGEQGVRTDYEALHLSRREEVRRAAIEKIVASQGNDHVARAVALTADVLKTETPFVLDAIYDDGLFRLNIDGLKKV